MNSSGEVQQAKFEAPPPQETTPEAGELQHDQALEADTPDENRVGKQQPPPVVATPVVLPPASDDNQTPLADPPAGATTPLADTPASHGHVIEKQWVDKAKTIVAQTRDDPFVQKKEMSKVKADYIQKRFNKTIPTDKSVTA